jgi:hypothetical protein
MEGSPRGPQESSPELDTSELNGAVVDEAFIRLAGLGIDSLQVDGCQLTGVRDVDRDHDAGVTTVVCEDESGGEHIFTYRPDSTSPVFHMSMDADAA